METRTDDLSGRALDWAVADTLTWGSAPAPRYFACDCGHVEAIHNADCLYAQSFSTDWGQGGMIIEYESIAIGRQVHRTEWWAKSFDGTGLGVTYRRTGPTPLIAAMRCYVASKRGYAVQVPDGFASVLTSAMV